MSICHAKHVTTLENYGRPSMVVCECGKGKFAGCPSVSYNSPIRKSLINQMDCSFRVAPFYYKNPGDYYQDDLLEDEVFDFIVQLNSSLSIQETYQQ